ncbi:hypothetical protein AVL48_26570 [Amycolatopsis regifaucium]|uniref:Uncharacterized protein n=1 Tax=Amycolatopsis regifaucium TaxID=546365 RepID=A0A154MPZ0_9PSEU|nr:hypothetical protein AVL48_26570 [Amycolatopsis regifaucium]OKA06447.1 hypothetical protein ATP06_0225380 [Amycolatopsis regifaucium]
MYSESLVDGQSDLADVSVRRSVNAASSTEPAFSLLTTTLQSGGHWFRAAGTSVQTEAWLSASPGQPGMAGNRKGLTGILRSDLLSRVELRGIEPLTPALQKCWS